ncbi:hypothetical protein [Microbulbifer variabilis]|uniref:hypothetical protein n=1 Tax=Microbulbifer variabilis TaxID=266805 RepID=UPI0012FC358E|nr:hypothetical protein [Microbulbifer variabilis]
MKYFDYFVRTLLAIYTVIITFGFSKQLSSILPSLLMDKVGILVETSEPVIYILSLTVVLIGYALAYGIIRGCIWFANSEGGTKTADSIDLAFDKLVASLKLTVKAILFIGLAIVAGVAIYYIVGGIASLSINTLLALILLAIIFRK